MDDSKIKIGIIAATVLIIVGGITILSGTLTGNSKKNFIREYSHQTDSTATSTLVEFSDFQCPACIVFHPIVKQVTADLKGKLNFVYRHFPLSQHKNALPAAFAAEAAGKQGKFWEMYDRLFTNHESWENLSSPEPEFEKYAKDLGLDSEKFKEDFKSDEIRKIVETDYQDGVAIGIDATPSFFVNGVKIENAQTAEDFKKAIEEVIGMTPTSASAVPAAYHAHFNLKVVANSIPIDFSNEKFQSKEGKETDSDIHFHDGIGDVVHIHKKGITVSEFFKTINMELTDDCLITDTKSKYCSEDKGNILVMWVNGKKQDKPSVFIPSDLDRVLVYYGKNEEKTINSFYDTVPDTACIYSEKCPDRGKAPNEECSGNPGGSCK